MSDKQIKTLKDKLAIAEETIIDMKKKLVGAKSAIKRLHPGDQVCDCINYHPYTDGVIGGFWSYDCDCKNYDNADETAAWCRQKNIYDELDSVVVQNL